MYTQCSECLTVFQLNVADLAAARGSVRCGHCNAVFDALRCLAEQLPPEPIERLAVHAVAPAPPRLQQPVFRPNPLQVLLFEDPRPPASAGQRAALPAFAARRRRRPSHTAAWLLGCSVLLLTLAAQVAWSERVHWIDDGRLRAWLEPICARLHCELPLRQDPARLVLLSRDIRPHPSVAGALMVSATLRNDAAFAQAFPTVKITLSDLDEKRIAMRRFKPRDYLAEARTIDAGLGAGASTALVFEVLDPGQNAVAFEFDFE